MRCKTMLLGGATILALAGALVSAPASAQSTNTQQAPAAQSGQSNDTQTATQTTHAAVHRHHHVRTASNESRQERATTKQLNEQQLAQATTAANTQTAQLEQTPAQPETGSTATPSDQSASTDTGQSNSALAANAPNPAATTPRSSESAPTSKADNSQDSASSAVDAMANTPKPQRTAQNGSSAPPPAGAEPLTQVQNPQQTLASAKVVGTSGTTIGTVSQVQSDSSGAPSKVEVKLDQSMGAGTRSVWINADKLQYLPQDNELTTPLTPQQVMNSM
jgi:hypothetical protein